MMCDMTIVLSWVILWILILFLSMVMLHATTDVYIRLLKFQGNRTHDHLLPRFYSFSSNILFPMLQNVISDVRGIYR